MATPVLSTIAQPPNELNELQDLAILTGGDDPTGFVTFELYRGPGCDDDPIATFPEVRLEDGQAFSPVSEPVGPGTYHWIAHYLGDGTNNPVSGECGDENETVVIPEPEPERTTPDLSTIAQQPDAQNRLQDVAILENSADASGFLTFELYRGEECGEPIFVDDEVPVDGDGRYTSALSPPLTPGTYNWIARYSGDERNFGVSGECGDENETVVIPEPEPEPDQPTTIRTVASGVNTANGEVRDTATLAGGDAPTGNMTFRLYGPSPTPVCTQANLVFTSVVTVAGNGDYESGAFVPATPGTYRWIASYSGDDDNLASQGVCADPDEDVTVLPRTPIGISVDKSAQPLTRPVPGGTFTFTVVVTNTGQRAVRIAALDDDIYGNLATRPNSTCDDLINVVLEPGASSDPCSFSVTFTGPAPTSQRDVVTATARDSFDEPVQAEDDATITLTRRTPTIATTASPTIVLGATVHDTAQLHGAHAPTGTVTFRLYGPSNETCAGTPVFSTTEPISDVGSAESDSFRPTAPGTYRWIASYDGDVNNAPIAGACNDPQERVEVVPVATQPTIVVQKDALPASRPAPGGDFEFRVRVTNVSDRALTLTTLTDSVYGDLDDLGTCDVPQELESGATYACTFTGVFIGGPGDSETDVVEAVAVDRDGNRARDTDDATVTLTARPILVVDDFGDPPPTTRPPVTTPPTVLPRVIVRTGTGSAQTAATAITLVSVGLLCVGLADERKRRQAQR